MPEEDVKRIVAFLATCFYVLHIWNISSSSHRFSSSIVFSAIIHTSLHPSNQALPTIPILETQLIPEFVKCIAENKDFTRTSVLC